MCDVGAGPHLLIDLLQILTDIDAPSSAIARDNGRASLQQEIAVLTSRRLSDRFIAVIMQVDETGGDGQSGAVNHAWIPGGLELADRDNPISSQRDVADPSRLARAVVNRHVGDDDVGINRDIRRKQGE